jgi:hypothetical protein
VYCLRYLGDLAVGVTIRKNVITPRHYRVAKWNRKARFRDPAVARFTAGMSGGGDFVMGDWGAAPGMQHLLLAEILGLAMARRAADILDRHRAPLTGTPTGGTGGAGRSDESGRSAENHGSDGSDENVAAGAAGDAGRPAEADDAQFALDNAIFSAVLDAANESLGQFDARPSDERWCDALLQLIQLAQVARDPAGPGQLG